MDYMLTTLYKCRNMRSLVRLQCSSGCQFEGPYFSTLSDHGSESPTTAVAVQTPVVVHSSSLSSDSPTVYSLRLVPLTRKPVSHSSNASHILHLTTIHFRILHLRLRLRPPPRTIYHLYHIPPPTQPGPHPGPCAPSTASPPRSCTSAASCSTLAAAPPAASSTATSRWRRVSPRSRRRRGQALPSTGLVPEGHGRRRARRNRHTSHSTGTRSR
ncbi:hypothetical protein BJ546DRAFT_947800 [Cryomyces antarcticus]